MNVPPEVVLGVRLAMGSPGRRGRTLLVASAAALGTAVLLTVFAIASTALQETASYSASEQLTLLAAITGSVALPVFVLAGTVGRLSAGVRDRRLANLRLLGLSVRRTRAVAAVEAGVGAVAGTAVGVLLAFAVRPLLTQSDPVVTDGFVVLREAVVPEWLVYLAVVFAMPAVSMAVAALPQRLDPARVLARATRADNNRPSAWRTGPLVLGILVCTVAARNPDGSDNVSTLRILALVLGVCLTAFGLVLVAPVFVRFLGDAMTRTARNPATLMTARRLQAQPAAVTRVVAALMIGLFLVTGARAVLGSFESTPQYIVAERAVNRPYLVTLTTDSPEDTPQLLSDVSGIDGVRAATSLPVLAAQCGPTPDFVCDAIVATCEQLVPYLDEATTRCRDDEVQWANRVVGEEAPPNGFTVRTRTSNEYTDTPSDNTAGDALAIPSPGPTVLSTQADNIEGSLADLPFSLRIPPTTPGIDQVAATTTRTILVSAAPGPGVVEGLQGSDVGGYSFQAPGFEDYDFVARIRSVLWTLAAVILSIGLLTFAVAAIDRTLTRQREVTGLLILGTPPRLIRRAQLLEAALPISAGSLLAIAAGLFAGSSYLGTVGETQLIPWVPTLVLTGCALAASAAFAGLTVLGSPTRISPNRIRTE